MAKKKSVSEFECVLLVRQDGDVEISNIEDYKYEIEPGQVPVGVTIRVPNSRFEVGIDEFIVELDDVAPPPIEGRTLEL